MTVNRFLITACSSCCNVFCLHIFCVGWWTCVQVLLTTWVKNSFMRSTARIQVTTKYLRSLCVKAMVFLVTVTENKSDKGRNCNTKISLQSWCILLCCLILLYKGLCTASHTNTYVCCVTVVDLIVSGGFNC